MSRARRLAHLGQLLLGHLRARARLRFGRLPPRQPLSTWNALFSRRTAAGLERESCVLGAFDPHLYGALNEPRLAGQIRFEYGTLLNWRSDWSGARVLDVGSGRSTLPDWMAARGADVVAFDYPMPVEARSAGKFDRLSRWLAATGGRAPATASGTMWALPFADSSFDLVTCLSVLEHVDTRLPDRAFVPYPEQRERLRQTLDEMVRVTAPGGHIYVTSDCCDYTRATDDAWRDSYYFDEGPAISGAWPVEDVVDIFYRHVEQRGCRLEGPLAFDPGAVRDGDPDAATYRGPHFSAFSVLAQREPR